MRHRAHPRGIPPGALNVHQYNGRVQCLDERHRFFPRGGFADERESVYPSDHGAGGIAERSLVVNDKNTNAVDIGAVRICR